MAQRRFQYEAGDWVSFAIDNRFAVAMLARVNRDGICLGYFMPRLFGSRPSLEALRGFGPGDAVLVHIFGGPDLTGGRWSVIGRDPQWDPSKWPLPAFRHRDSISGRWHIREYSDDEALWIISDRLATDEEVADLPKDGCGGSRYMEEVIADLFGVTSGHADDEAITAKTDPPQHYLYFHDKELAEHAAEACRNLGLDPVFAPSADEQKPWLLLARHRTGSAAEDEMERVGQRLAAVAEEWGGEYDGWDKPG